MRCAFLILFSLFAHWSSAVWAEDFSRYAGEVRVGMEIELAETYIQHIADYYDLSALGTELEKTARAAISADGLKQFEITRESFAALPSEIRKEWSAKIAGFKGAEGKAKLQALWNGLPEVVKRAQVPLNFLPVSDRAHLIYSVAGSRGDKDKVATPPLHSDEVLAAKGMRPELRALFRRLFWHRDLSTLELIHADEYPIRDLDVFAADVDLLTEATKTRKELYEVGTPRKTDPLSSYHIHISTTKKRNLTSFAQAYNRLLLLRLVNQGSGRALSNNGSGRTLYSENLLGKGLVRLLDDGERVELRDHTKNPKEELAEVMDILYLPGQPLRPRSDQEIQRIINQKTQELLTERNMTRIARLKPDVLIEVIKNSRSHTESPLEFSDPKLASALVKAVEGGNGDSREMEKIPGHLMDLAETNPEAANWIRKQFGPEGNPQLRHAVLVEIGEARFNGKHRAGITAVLASGDPKELKQAWERLKDFRDNTPGVGETLEPLLSHSNPEIQKKALTYLVELGIGNPSARAAVLRFLQNPKGQSQLFLQLSELAEKTPWLLETLVAAKGNRSLAKEVQANLELALANPKLYEEKQNLEFWLKELEKSPSRVPENRILEGLGQLIAKDYRAYSSVKNGFGRATQARNRAQLYLALAIAHQIAPQAGSELPPPDELTETGLTQIARDRNSPPALQQMAIQTKQKALPPLTLVQKLKGLCWGIPRLGSSGQLATP